MQNNRYFFIELLNDQDIDLGLAWWIDFFIISFLLLGISILLTVSSKLIVRSFLKKLSKRTKSHIDDYLLSSKFPLYFSRIIPYFFLLSVVPLWIIDSPRKICRKKSGENPGWRVLMPPLCSASTWRQLRPDREILLSERHQLCESFKNSHETCTTR